jgi:hypothetical protein
MVVGRLVRRYISVAGINQRNEQSQGEDLFHGFHLRIDYKRFSGEFNCR